MGSGSGAPVPTGRVGAALDDVDRLGGFFSLAVGPAARGADDPEWRPLTALTAAGGPLGARVDEVAAALGAPRRVAASLLAMSVAARFTSVLLAAAVEHRVLPDLRHDRLYWKPWSGGPLPLWAEEPQGHALDAPDDPGTADRVASELAEVHLRPLVEAVHAVASVPPRTLWGNASSSLAGSVRVLATARPASRPAATALARAVVARPPFTGLGEFVAEPAHPTGLGFARRSCCLYYRVPGGGLCEDCVLVRR